MSIVKHFKCYIIYFFFLLLFFYVFFYIRFLHKANFKLLFLMVELERPGLKSNQCLSSFNGALGPLSNQGILTKYL